jgi:hypothetical protein
MHNQPAQHRKRINAPFCTGLLTVRHPATCFSTIGSNETLQCRASLSMAALAGAALELLAEEDQLDLVVDGEHTSTGDTTEDVGTGSLEQRLDTLVGHDLVEGVEGGLVLDGLRRLDAISQKEGGLPRQTSSSCDDEQCPGDTSRYRNQW